MLPHPILLEVRLSAYWMLCSKISVEQKKSGHKYVRDTVRDNCLREVLFFGSWFFRKNEKEKLIVLEREKIEGWWIEGWWIEGWWIEGWGIEGWIEGWWIEGWWIEGWWWIEGGRQR